MMDSGAMVDIIFRLLAAVMGGVALLVLIASLCLSPVLIIKAIRRRGGRENSDRSLSGFSA